jgi:hypothetical protein
LEINVEIGLLSLVEFICKGMFEVLTGLR